MKDQRDTPNTIFILDDEFPRLDAMRSALTASLPTVGVATVNDAPSAIEWLESNLSTAALISLDHDLFPLRPDSPDPGTGRDVADFLARFAPQCHVIIHTTNALAAPGMKMVLDDAGWANSRVSPYNDLDWIAEWWIEEVCEHLIT